MNIIQRYNLGRILSVVSVLISCCLTPSLTRAGDLADIRQRGVLRHLGVPYAHFVMATDKGVQGLDAELMQLFAKHLGVRYEWIETSWSDVIGDLSGKKVQQDGDTVTVTGETVVRGDIIANGLTVLPWREKIITYSKPTFPTGVWLVARIDSQLKPIEPSGDIKTDIQHVKKLLAGRSLLAMKGTCLDPNLYDLSSTKADIRLYTASQNLNEIAPAILKGAAEATLLDIPDALVALQQWPDDIKVIGPISEQQFMGVATAKSSPELLAAFNDFFVKFKASGGYDNLVRKYYPSVYLYFGDFFKVSKGE